MYIQDYQQDQDNKEDEGHKRTQFGSKTALARIRIYVCGQCVQSDGTSCEECNGEIIERHGEGEEEAAYHTRSQLRDKNLEKCLGRCRSKV